MRVQEHIKLSTAAALVALPWLKRDVYIPLAASVLIPAASTLHKRATLTAQTGGEHSLALSPDGKNLAIATRSNIASHDNGIKIWQIAPGNEQPTAWTTKAQTTLFGHRGPVRCLAFSADGKTLVSGGGNTISFSYVEAVVAYSTTTTTMTVGSSGAATVSSNGTASSTQPVKH